MLISSSEAKRASHSTAKWSLIIQSWADGQFYPFLNLIKFWICINAKNDNPPYKLKRASNIIVTIITEDQRGTFGSAGDDDRTINPRAPQHYSITIPLRLIDICTSGRALSAAHWHIQIPRLHARWHCALQAWVESLFRVTSLEIEGTVPHEWSMPIWSASRYREVIHREVMHREVMHLWTLLQNEGPVVASLACGCISTKSDEHSSDPEYSSCEDKVSQDVPKSNVFDLTFVRQILFDFNNTQRTKA